MKTLNGLKGMFILGLFFIISCDSSIGEDVYQPCDLEDANNRFSQLRLKMPSTEVDKIIGSTRYKGRYGAYQPVGGYEWLICDLNEVFISGIFVQDSLWDFRKNFRGTECSEKVDQQNYDLISNGNSYEEIASIFQAEGEFSGERFNFYLEKEVIFIWYHCNENYKSIEVVFQNSLAVSKSAKL